MPRRDGTGPMGMGPITGRGAGYCNGFAESDYAKPLGFAGGFGRGRGHRKMFYATGMPGWARCGYPVYNGTSEASFDEKAFLTTQAEFLENQLQQIKKRISGLSKESE